MSAAPTGCFANASPRAPTCAGSIRSAADPADLGDAGVDERGEAPAPVGAQGQPLAGRGLAAEGPANEPVLFCGTAFTCSTAKSTAAGWVS